MVSIPQFDPYTKAIKKYMYDIMPDKYTEQTDEIIERVVQSLVTKQDAERYIRFLGDVFQAGYNKAMESVSESIEKHGYKIKITPPKILHKP